MLCRYKYCIAMENSIAQDYVTEKVYDALAAGCLPIYLGAPNIEDYVPTPDAIIDYAKLGSVEALAEELRRLSADNEAYTAHFRWRDQPETWGKRFQDIVETAAADVHTQCRVCQASPPFPPTTSNILIVPGQLIVGEKWRHWLSLCLQSLIRAY